MSSELKQLFRQLMKDGDKLPQSFVATVTAVDKQKESCTLQPLDGSPEVHNARLTAVIADVSSKLVIYPVINSTVIASLIQDNENAVFISCFSEIEEIKIKVGDMEVGVKENEISFNGGLNGGLVLSKVVASRLARLEERMSSHQHIYLSPVSGMPTPTTHDPVTNLPLIKTKASDLENKKVKH